MGWSSGTELMERIVERVRSSELNAIQRYEIYLILIDEFENSDWDGVCQMLLTSEPMFDRAVYDLHPEFKDDPA